MESIIGATIGSYLKLLSSEKAGLEELSRLVYLAKRYSSCSQVLVAVADYLDFIYGWVRILHSRPFFLSSNHDFISNFSCWKHVVSINRVNCRPALEADISKRIYSEEFQADKVEDAVQVFADNLRHSDKGVRLSTLRILCHYEPLQSANLAKESSIDNEMEAENFALYSDDLVGSEVSLSMFVYLLLDFVLESYGFTLKLYQVLRLLLSVESTSTSISTSRKIILLISGVQKALLAERIPEAYLLVALNGIIGIFQNRFSYIWDQASECLASLIRKHSGFVWDKLICYFQKWLCLLDQPGRDTSESSDELNGMLVCAIRIFLAS